ncbi:MAG: alpha/beta hydrolase-fold protein [Candidatus Krumholzibacteria bacterium]|nr:alpha/beta hydrolase-fold protein [Candidatus Krumholzibacteria bacterium]
MRTGKIMGLLVSLVAASITFCACDKPAPPPTEGETPLTIGSSFPLESAVLGETRTITVSLPYKYHENPDSYPVLYLVDGGFEQDFVPMAGMSALASLSGQFHEFILVGVQTNNRYYELTAPSEVPFDLEKIPVNGGADKFRQHLLDEVKPFIEGRYRTSGEDAIIGESLAGLFIAETFLRAPASFDHYVAVSPSLWWLEMTLSREAAGLLNAAGFPANRSFYFTIADEGGDMHEGVERLAAALENHAPDSLNWWYRPMLDEHHNTIYSPATLQALRLIFAPEQ